MELEVTKPKVIEDGTHTGTITAVDYRDSPFAYTDVEVTIDNSEGFKIKYGCPTSPSINGKLMKLLAKFASVSEGVKVDPEKTLLARKIEFLTLSEETKKGNFVRIVDDSIKPVG